MHRLRILTLALLVVSSATLAPTTAHASTELIIKETTGHRRPMQLDFTGNAWFFGNTTWIGGAAWFGFPILDEGFVPPWNDSLVIEGGFIFNYFFVTTIGSDYSYLAVSPLVGVRWNVHLLEQLTVFATGKIGLRFPVAGDTVGVGTRVDWLGSVGAYWHLSDSFYLRAEMGNSFQVGISIPLGTP